MRAGKSKKTETATLNISRVSTNLCDGKKNRKTVFYARHRSVQILDKMYTLLLNSKMLRGGDIIVWKIDDIAQQEFKLCMVCAKLTTENDQSRCDTCCKRHNADTENCPYVPGEMNYFRTFLG